MIHVDEFAPNTHREIEQCFKIHIILELGVAAGSRQQRCDIVLSENNSIPPCPNCPTIVLLIPPRLLSQPEIRASGINTVS